MSLGFLSLYIYVCDYKNVWLPATVLTYKGTKSKVSIAVPSLLHFRCLQQRIRYIGGEIHQYVQDTKDRFQVTGIWGWETSHPTHSSNFCDKFYVRVEIFEVEYCATLNIIKNWDMKKNQKAREILRKCIMPSCF